jgi:hypothetical protein
MSLSQDILIFNDSITSWNQNTQDLPVDPNTLPPTPPHTHNPPVASDMSPWDSEAAPAVEGWNVIPDTVHDEAIAANAQAEEFGGMPERLGADGEKGDRPHRRPREYGISPISSHLSFYLLVVLFLRHLGARLTL